MKNIFLAFSLSLALLAFSSGCKKHDEGFGGTAVLSGKVVHHTNPIPNAMVFIKFGAKEAPGTDSSAYDSSVMADSLGNYSISGLKAGNYYLYGTGFDNSIAQTVIGGTPVKLKSDDEHKTIDVPVTEN